MATTKTLTPTNQAITLAAFTEKPDNRTNVTNDDKLADAVNALNSKIQNIGQTAVTQFDTDFSTNRITLWFTSSTGDILRLWINAAGIILQRKNGSAWDTLKTWA